MFELDDILEPERVCVQLRRRFYARIEVADQGHAPLLAEPDVIARITESVRGRDR